MEKYQSILRKYWGYSDFRPLQEDIIDAVCQGNDVLGLMPTGGGKSITFQVPALYMSGICIVVTPLIALMKDQVENLRMRNIMATAIYSGITSKEIDIIFVEKDDNDLKQILKENGEDKNYHLMENYTKKKVRRLIIENDYEFAMTAIYIIIDNNIDVDYEDEEVVEMYSTIIEAYEIQQQYELEQETKRQEELAKKEREKERERAKDEDEDKPVVSNKPVRRSMKERIQEILGQQSR